MVMTFNPIGKWAEGDNLNETNRISHNYNEVLAYISKFWGKYVHMKFSYNTNYSDTRDIEPEWCCDYEVNAFLYRYIPSNQCLFGIVNKLNDTFTGGVSDKSIDLFRLMQGHRLEINEIDESEFVEKAVRTVTDCLRSRINKINSEKYELTENGYKGLL